MPSLVYIARILNFSEELTERLKAAGFQVSSFGPGRITAGECLLVMTPEAAAAGLKPANSGGEAPRRLCGGLGLCGDASARRGHQCALEAASRFLGHPYDRR